MKAPTTLAPCDHDECGITECRHAKEKADDRLPLTTGSRLVDYIESPPPYQKHVTKEKLWLVLDAHGDSVLWSDQEIAVDAAVEALNHMAGIITENNELSR